MTPAEERERWIEEKFTLHPTMDGTLIEVIVGEIQRDTWRLVSPLFDHDADAKMWALCFKTILRDAMAFADAHPATDYDALRQQLEGANIYADQCDRARIEAEVKLARLEGGMKFMDVASGEWVQPTKHGYKWKCCDCGLVHIMDFRVVKYAKGKRAKVQFRVWRAK